MFREMRRKRQQMTTERAIGILENATSGILAVSGDDGYPYAVPVSYVYRDSRIYFHSAGKGQKIEALAANPKVSFCVVGSDQIVPEKYTTYFSSVIAFGKAHIMEEGPAKREALELLARKYAPDDSAENRRTYIEKEYSAVCMVELEIEHMTGKEAVELAAREA